MSPRSLRLVAILVLLLLALGVLLNRCQRPSPAPVPDKSGAASPATASAAAAVQPAPSPTPAENLSPATLTAPTTVVAGGKFQVSWTGPDNSGDYVTIVPVTASEADYASYAETRLGASLMLTAPLDAGVYEVRYVASRAKKVLGRTPVTVSAAAASLTAPATAVLGTTILVEWTGPDNAADYITVVPKGTPDGRYRNYTETRHGSPLKLELLPEPGAAELRYMTGQGARVLARRDLTILQPETSVAGPAEVIAGKTFTATWVGPNNPGDYLTIVAQGTPDGRYDNYAETRKGSPLQLTALIQPGEAELRYMTGQGARVLARCPIRIVAAGVTLDAPAEVVAGASVAVIWTGPDNSGDYLTIVRHGTPDGQYARYADASRGSPARIEAPIDVGPAEIRYMSGQGARVLARRPLTTTAPVIALKPPAHAVAGTTIAVEWSGPDNRGDYLAIVPLGAGSGSTPPTAPTSRGSPATLRVPTQAGAAEVRYLSGQDNRVLGRSPLEITGKMLAGER